MANLEALKQAVIDGNKKDAVALVQQAVQEGVDPERLFNQYLTRYGLTFTYVDTSFPERVTAAIRPETKIVWIETPTNPLLKVTDVQAVADIAHAHGCWLGIDSTFATPALLRPLEWGADIVVHSTTKYLSGHGDATGGVVIDSGAFPWAGNDRFPDFKPFIDRKGPLAFLDKVWREHHINFGTTQAPLHSYLTMVGLDTLALRMERHLANAQQVAAYLQSRSEVAWINYPGLLDNPSHAVADRQFGGLGFGGVLAFGLADQAACFRFINSLQMVYHLANLGDCKTLVIHPYSSQYLSFDEPTRQALAISADLVRLSVGIEAVEDICADLGQALDSI